MTTSPWFDIQELIDEGTTIVDAPMGKRTSARERIRADAKARGIRVSVRSRDDNSFYVVNLGPWEDGGQM